MKEKLKHKPFLEKHEIENHWNHNIKNAPAPATSSISEQFNFDDVEIEFGGDVDEEFQKHPGVLETFDDALFPQSLQDVIRKFARERKLGKPTILQSVTIPFILNSSLNLEVCSSPGMGKTLMYALPILDYILRQKENEFLNQKQMNRALLPRHRKPYAVIVVPNYTLARQIGAEIGGLARLLDHPVSIYLADQVTQCKYAANFLNTNGCDIVIGTGGRIRSSFTPRQPVLEYALESDNLRYLVFDDIAKKDVYFECFETLIASSRLRVISVGAEPLKELQPILGEFTVYIKLGDHSLRSNVEFRFLKNPEFDAEAEMAKKAKAIFSILMLKVELKTLIVVSSVETAKTLRHQLHGLQTEKQKIVFDAFGEEKEKKIEDFRSGVIQTLVASHEIFSRGIHIPQLARVILYELPQDESIFWRCAGRCGRMGMPGIVWSFVGEDRKERSFAAEVLEDHKEKVPDFLRT